MNRYAQVVLGLPVDKSFIYSIPDNLRESIQVGQRVEVPFGKRFKIGYVVGLRKSTSLKKTRLVKDIIEPEPLLDREMLRLTRRVADYYCASWGEVIEAAYPANVRRRKRPISRARLLPSILRNDEEEQGREKFSLTPQQRRALDLITRSIKKRSHRVFLLYGITASGKTEVYLQAIAHALAQGSSSIVLVPEISLTPQTVERFRARFGTGIAIMHSRLTAGERAWQWKMIKQGEAKIVIGARSAVFSPVKDLGLIVIDEEHETTYKQKDASPRYHAREVAILRAKEAGATVILGSATPSLESFYNAKCGRIKLLQLPARVTRQDLPCVRIIDMRQEIATRKRRTNIFSRTLQTKIQEVLHRGEQVILFLNRRGFSTFINCLRCGYVAKCRRCQVSLVYHYASRCLVCHYCNYCLKPPEICPQCKGDYLRYFGLGTEKVESELHRLFPQARIARMDTDVTTQRDAHTRILSDFKEGKIDILVGTQMVAKGLDFPRVSLVGVICADTALHLPDFRSGERTFNLLTQVGGRAGRGKSEGEVIIQTYVPQHYAIVASKSCDYQQFYRQEIKSRRQLRLPPFTHLVNLTLRSRSQKKVENLAHELCEELKKKGAVSPLEVLGPAPATIPKIRGDFRWNVLLKARAIPPLVKVLKKVLSDFKRYKGVPLSVDVDPL